MEPKEAPGKENMGTKKKNLPFLRPRLYMLERRKTDTVVESSIPGNHSGTLRRSQSVQRAKGAPIANSSDFATGAEVKWVNDGP